MPEFTDQDGDVYTVTDEGFVIGLRRKTDEIETRYIPFLKDDAPKLIAAIAEVAGLNVYTVTGEASSNVIGIPVNHNGKQVCIDRFLLPLEDVDDFIASILKVRDDIKRKPTPEDVVLETTLLSPELATQVVAALREKGMINE